MRVIPVLDVAGGRAVRASGGRRECYPPLRSVFTDAGTVGDALAVARAYRDRLACRECYVADLDAIAGRPVDGRLIGALAGLGLALLVDAGVADPERARDLVAAGARRVVVGLETLPRVGTLARVVRALGSERVVFSLDLRDGTPLGAAARHAATTPLELARAAWNAGARAVLVLDLARVGSGRGMDRRLLATLRRALPRAELLAGGGIAGAEELEPLAQLGLDGVLVASALHDGRLTRRDMAVAGRPAGRCAHSSDSR
ncbi:MAG TPA: HisA/HisF-related TIM barrel protein [Gemmatimonadales bacterium]|nr:HisA/HisF-related TIM barrel protein [Gemmatimonadales bacterium]